MKAVIVECSNSTAIALCDDGSFKRLPNQGYSIGQELLIKQKASRNRTIRRLSICASLALFLSAFAGVGSYSYVHPYSYVSLDINPSIEYALNRYDKVIEVAGVNDDGKQVVSSIKSDVKNQSITAALSTTIEQLEKDNYISKKEESHVIISVCSNNNSKAESIASKVNTLSEEKAELCSIDTVTVSQEVKEDADSLGITPGKLALIQAVAQTSPEEDFNISDWTDKTVAELETTIQQANVQTADSKDTHAQDIDTEYPSSVLDDSTMNKPSDSSIAASVKEADTEKNSSVTDDKQTDTTNITTPASADINPEASSQKPDSNTDVMQPPVPDETGTEVDTVPPVPADTGTTEKPDVPEVPASDTSIDSETQLPASNDASTKKPDADTQTENTSSKSSEDASSASTSKDSSDETLNSSNSTSKNSSFNEDSSSKDIPASEEVPSQENVEEPEIVSPSSSRKSSYPEEQESSEATEIDSNTNDEAGNLTEDETTPLSDTIF